MRAFGDWAILAFEVREGAKIGALKIGTDVFHAQSRNDDTADDHPWQQK